MDTDDDRRGVDTRETRGEKEAAKKKSRKTARRRSRGREERYRLTPDTVE